jgi:anti-sigma-K factor RskA
VSLNASQQRTLGYMADYLADTAPELASMLSVFNRLTFGEEMPDRREAGETARGTRHRPRVWRIAAVALTVVTAIAITLVLTLTGHGSSANPGCTRTWPIVCARR